MIWSAPGTSSTGTMASKARFGRTRIQIWKNAYSSGRKKACDPYDRGGAVIMGRIGIRLGGSQSKAAAEVLARHQPADIAG